MGAPTPKHAPDSIHRLLNAQAEAIEAVGEYLNEYQTSAHAEGLITVIAGYHAQLVYELERLDLVEALDEA